MIAVQQQRITEPEAGNLVPLLQSAVAMLAKADAYARDAGADRWEFAVEIDRLLRLGLTRCDLRWLANKGYVEHGCEITGWDDKRRRFRSGENLALTDQTCFVATDAGLSLAKGTSVGPMVIRYPGPIVQPDAETPERPKWDGERRVLLVGGQVVKRYKVPSPSQEAILAAFQEEGWPRRIDDPLSPVPDRCPKERLHSTIKHLNSSQENHLVRFRGDGTGEGVVWERIEGKSHLAVRAKRRRFQAA
jgi:hypothetical protein